MASRVVAEGAATCLTSVPPGRDQPLNARPLNLSTDGVQADVVASLRQGVVHIDRRTTRAVAPCGSRLQEQLRDPRQLLACWPVPPGPWAIWGGEYLESSSGRFSDVGVPTTGAGLRSDDRGELGAG